MPPAKMMTPSSSPPPPPLRDGFVGVHIGAGQHSEARTATYLAICASACQRAVQVLLDGGTALEAATEATMVLEDAGETNAGYGSNLSESGTVEMDAGIMDGTSLLFGAVGAVPGIKNPIMVAKLMVEEQQKGLLPLGRVPPGFLVGEGAREWAIRHGVPSVEQESLISEKSNKLFRHYKKKLDSYMKNHNLLQNGGATTNNTRKRSNINHTAVSNGVSSIKNGRHGDAEIIEEDDRVTDTVGVVVMDRCGRVASTVSSGGIALKQPGRVGQASCFGCGCWAQSKMGPQKGFSVGISTTGCGEHLVRTFLARECALSLGSDVERSPLEVVKDIMRYKFAESPFLEAVPEKLGGAICMQYDDRCGRGDFLWTHTTASMGIAYMTTSDAKATTVMSRLPPKTGAAAANSARGETTILVEGVPFETFTLRRPDSVSSSSEDNSSSASSSAASTVPMVVESQKA